MKSVIIRIYLTMLFNLLAIDVAMSADYSVPPHKVDEVSGVSQEILASIEIDGTDWPEFLQNQLAISEDEYRDHLKVMSHRYQGVGRVKFPVYTLAKEGMASLVSGDSPNLSNEWEFCEIGSSLPPILTTTGLFEGLSYQVSGEMRADNIAKPDASFTFNYIILGTTLKHDAKPLFLFPELDAKLKYYDIQVVNSKHHYWMALSGCKFKDDPSKTFDCGTLKKQNIDELVKSVLFVGGMK